MFYERAKHIPQMGFEPGYSGSTLERDNHYTTESVVQLVRFY